MINKREQNYAKTIYQGDRFLKKQEAREKRNAEWLKQLPILVQCNFSHQTMMVIAFLCLISQIRAASFEPSKTALNVNQTFLDQVNDAPHLELAQLHYVTSQLQAKNDQLLLDVPVSTSVEQDALQVYKKERTEILNQQQVDYRELKLGFQALRKNQLAFNEQAQKLSETQSAIVFKRDWYELQRIITVALSKLNTALFKKYTDIQVVFEALQNKKWQLIQKINRPESEFSEETEIMLVAQLGEMMKQIKEERLFFKESVHHMLQGIFHQVAYRLEERKQLIAPFFDTPEVNRLYSSYQFIFNELDQLHLSRDPSEPDKKYLDLAKSMAELDEELPKVLIKLTHQLNPFDQVLVFRTLKQLKSYEKLLFVGGLLTILGSIGGSLFCMFRREPQIVTKKVGPDEQHLREEIHCFENGMIKFKNKLRKLMLRVEGVEQSDDILEEEEFVIFKKKMAVFSKKFLALQNDMIERFNQFRESSVQEEQGLIEISILKNRKNSIQDEYHQILGQCLLFEALKNRQMSDGLDSYDSINSEKKLKNALVLQEKINHLARVYQSTFEEFDDLNDRFKTFERESIPFAKKVIFRLRRSLDRVVCEKSEERLFSKIENFFEKYQSIINEFSEANLEKMDFLVQTLKEKQEILNSQKQDINSENYFEKMQFFSALNQDEDKSSFKTIQQGIKKLQLIFKKVEKIEMQFFTTVDELNIKLLSLEMRSGVACI